MFRKKQKKGIRLQIPGFGDRQIQTLLSDCDGTLLFHGQLSEGLEGRLIRIADFVDVHILTADKKAKSTDRLGALPVHVHILSSDDQDVQKRDYLKQFAASNVAVFGNGNNDRLLMEAVKNNGGVCIAVDNGEGCSIAVMMCAHLLIHGATQALDLLLRSDVCAATLRY